MKKNLSLSSENTLVGRQSIFLSLIKTAVGSCRRCRQKDFSKEKLPESLQQALSEEVKVTGPNLVKNDVTESQPAKPPEEVKVPTLNLDQQGEAHSKAPQDVRVPSPKPNVEVSQIPFSPPTVAAINQLQPANPPEEVKVPIQSVPQQVSKVIVKSAADFRELIKKDDAVRGECGALLKFINTNLKTLEKSKNELKKFKEKWDEKTKKILQLCYEATGSCDVSLAIPLSKYLEELIKESKKNAVKLDESKVTNFLEQFLSGIAQVLQSDNIPLNLAQTRFENINKDNFFDAMKELGEEAFTAQFAFQLSGMQKNEIQETLDWLVPVAIKTVSQDNNTAKAAVGTIHLLMQFLQAPLKSPNNVNSVVAMIEMINGKLIVASKFFDFATKNGEALPPELEKYNKLAKVQALTDLHPFPPLGYRLKLLQEIGLKGSFKDDSDFILGIALSTKTQKMLQKKFLDLSKKFPQELRLFYDIFTLTEFAQKLAESYISQVPVGFLLRKSVEYLSQMISLDKKMVDIVLRWFQRFPVEKQFREYWTADDDRKLYSRLKPQNVLQVSVTETKLDPLQQMEANTGDTPVTKAKVKTRGVPNPARAAAAAAAVNPVQEVKDDRSSPSKIDPKWVEKLPKDSKEWIRALMQGGQQAERLLKILENAFGEEVVEGGSHRQLNLPGGKRLVLSRDKKKGVSLGVAEDSADAIQRALEVVSEKKEKEPV